MNVGILGLGEVGSAIKQLVSKSHQVYVRELKYDEINTRAIDILHVCIPFTPTFTKGVIKAITDIKPNLVIINSTVKPGTTNHIHQRTRVHIAHAPILGVHPNLYEYLFKFTKPIGAVDTTSYKLVKDHFEKLGVKTEKFDSPIETEMAKILGTTYYGWAILFEKWVHELCTKQKVNFDQIYSRYNHIYNQGYQQDLPHVIRPILTHKPGPIGGHCVIPNTDIIHTWLKDDFTDFILKQNRKLADSEHD